MTEEWSGKYRDNPEYLALQNDERFQSWLLMQEAAIEIEFIIFDVPALNELDDPFTREGLVIAESAALDTWPDWRSAFTDDNRTLSGRYIYFIGETFRREVEGKWVATPPTRRHGVRSCVDAEYRAKLYDPTEMLGTVLARRSGDRLARVFGHAVRTHQEWVDAGRPPRGQWPGSE